MKTLPQKHHEVRRLDVKRLAEVDTDSLRSELASALKLTAGHLDYLAAIWAELENRGVDLGDLKQGIGFYLSRIAAKKLMSAVVVKFASEPVVINRLSNYDLETQQKVVDGAELPWVKEKPARVVGRPSVSATARVLGEEGERNKTTASTGRRDLPDPIAVAKVASVGDLAETIIGMVENCQSPRELAERLMNELKKFTAKKVGR